MPHLTNTLVRKNSLSLRRSLPQSWINAIGILKGKNINPLRYQKQERRGWTKRLKKLSKIVIHAH
ncbi:hypothetical protein HY504_02315 [Candidatus Wolfebacteria bacterium]|nr:hypothetical protein [Candidatus Wolfebacteria bacterium]